MVQQQQRHILRMLLEHMFCVVLLHSQDRVRQLLMISLTFQRKENFIMSLFSVKSEKETQVIKPSTIQTSFLVEILDENDIQVYRCTVSSLEDLVAKLIEFATRESYANLPKFNILKTDVVT